MSTAATAPVTPDAEGAGIALARIKEYLADHRDDPRVRLTVDGESDDLVVPRQAVELLARVLAHVAVGEGVTVVPSHAELTTQQAADLLNVSRPYLIRLLDSEEIAYRKVGKHRRISASALLEYRRADDQRRRRAADELSALTQELGLA